MSQTPRRVLVDLVSFTSRVRLRFVSDEGALRGEVNLSLEEFNQHYADCQRLHEQVNGCAVIQFQKQPE